MIKALVVIGTVGNGFRCEEAVPGSLGVWWLGVAHWMFLHELWFGKQTSTAGNLDLHLTWQ